MVPNLCVLLLLSLSLFVNGRWAKKQAVSSIEANILVLLTAYLCRHRFRTFRVSVSWDPSERLAIVSLPLRWSCPFQTFSKCSLVLLPASLGTQRGC